MKVGAWQEENGAEAYLTVYMALLLTVIISLALALIEGSRSGAIRMESEIITETCMENLLAEFHRELASQYGILALDTSYGEETPAVAISKSRLQNYLDRNCSVDEVILGGLLYKDFLGMEMKAEEVRGIRLLTDDKGGVFRKRAVEALAENKAISYPEQIWDWLREVEDRSLTEGGGEKEREASYRELDVFIEKERLPGQKGKGENGSLQALKPLKDLLDGLRALEGDGVLKYVIQEPLALSDARISCAELVSERRGREEINIGNLPASHEKRQFGEEIERLLFQEYMMCYGSYFGNELDKSRMKYQLEYVVGGNEKDKDNLKEVVRRILAIRETANTLCLMSDETKRQGVKTLAEGLSAAVLVPEAAPVLEAVLILGWAYVESLADVRSLLRGNRVPLIKDGEEWKTDMGLLFESGEEEKAGGQGLSYGDYLRIFFLLGDLETETFRFMDMMEADIRQTEGNEFFRIDGCLDQIETQIGVSSRYGYNFRICRCRGY